MKNTLKRLLSLLLVLSMILSVAPAVFAAEASGDAETTVPVVTEEAQPVGTEEAETENTEASEEPTMAPEETTVAPEETTTAPEETTAPAGDVTVEAVISGEAVDAAMVGEGINMTAAKLTVISNTTNNVAGGVSYDKLVVKNGKNQQAVGYLTQVDLKQHVTIKAAYNGYYTNGSNAAARAKAYKDMGWSFSTTTGLARDYASIADPAGTVVMATNGDFFNMGTGEPTGYLIMEGNPVKTASAEPYFAILKDGTAVIRDSGVDHSDVLEAISGPFYLIKNGEIVADKNDTSQMPRNSVGIRADGSVVFFQADGRQAPYSVGMTYYELASVLKDAGCVNALYLDGGGSATVAARPEGADTLKVINSPSDGAEREVSSAVLIVSTAAATGIFDHAAITPYDELYTPKSTIQFTAAGVDTAGAPMAVPADVTWALADSCADMGTIDAKGLFIAGEKTGTVTVEMRQGSKCVGSATIEIVVPDSIYFNSDEISLGFEETTDFNVIVRYQERDIHYKVGDIVWSITDSQMGTFDGNLFTSSDGKSLNGDVTATSAYNDSVKGTIHVIVGALPTLVWDFEDVVTEGGTVIPAEGYYGSLLSSTAIQLAEGSFEIVSIDDDEPVRFGEKSLKMNYDFTKTTGKATAGVYIGTEEATSIPGNPTGIGVWVYAPEGVGVKWDGKNCGFWLRGYVVDGAGATLPYDFTFEPKNAKVQSGELIPGIYWDGWMYLEADLTAMTGPFKIQEGYTFRLMYVPGIGMGSQTANAIYLDNFQFVYGTNVDDVDNPTVDSISVANVELENGGTLNTNTFSIRTTFSDVQNKYTSGVDASTVRMYIDGVNVVDNDKYSFAMNASDGYAELYNLKLADGTHSVTVSLRDGFGNEAEETRYFTVKGGTVASPAVTVAPAEKIASLGGTVNLEIRASDSTVANSSTTIRLGNMFPGYTVVFSDSYTGSYKYSKSSSAVTITAQRKADAPAEDDGLIAKLVVNVPATLTENETFPYEVVSGSYTTSSGYYGTYAVGETKLPVGAGISLSNEPILVGGAKGVIKVVDLQGKGAANVGIYLVSDNSRIGTTDENGEWETDYFSAAAGKTAVYAKTEDGLLSFHYNVFTYDAAASVETQLLYNAVADSTTQKNITWTSNPLTSGVQSIRYRVKGSTSKKWTLEEAETTLKTFATGGNKAVNINRITLSDLTPGTTYEYQVGANGKWSESASFVTDSASASSTRFFVMSDIQAEDLTNVNNMIKQIQAAGYDFGIQTGDAIDNVDNFSMVSETVDLLGVKKLGDLDMIRVLGNHEYYGDLNAEITSTLYNLPESKPGSCYSVTYGDVYVAVINFTNTTDELTTALDWLVKDAKNSDATWKVLTMHQPPYYTSAVGGNAPIYEHVPDACEEAGINVVFSGHDHSLTRTFQLTNDKIDTENGILYYIGGSSGEKSYSITSQDIFDYDTTFAVATTEFTATYIGVSADSHKMVLEMYDVAADGSRKVVDTYTLYTETGACAAAGHKLENAEHANGKLTCKQCGETVSPADAGYTGWAVDKASGNPMYFVSGKAQVGEFLFDKDTYYFDENGVAYNGKATVDEVELEFNKGLLVGGYTGFVKKSNGNTYHYINGKMSYGWYQENGYWYHFDTETGVMNTQKHVKPDAEAMSKNAYYDFGEDGKLQYAYFNPYGYYYWAGLPLADSWVKLSTDPDAWYRTNGSAHYVTDRSVRATVVIAVDGVEYTFDNTNGKLLKGSFVLEKGKWYYYWAGEPVNDGWFELDGNTYYAYSDGHLATGSNTIDGKTYMFTSAGVLVTSGMILTADLTQNCEKMSIKLVNADEKLDSVRFAVWAVNAGQESTLKWVDAQKNGDGMWTVTIPMCQFNMNVADTFAIHAYTTVENEPKFLVDTTVEVPVAVPHTYTDDKDTTCNICGEELRPTQPEKIETIPMFRLYNPNSGEHFYTGSEEERDNLVEAGWNYEGIAWNAPVYTGTPVHRLFNPNSGDHHYTMSMEEVNNLVDVGWKYEGIAWNSASAEHVPQYRLYNPNADVGSHHYTSSIEERDNLVVEGWKLEGIGWFGMVK